MFDNQVTRQQWGQTNARDSEILSDMPVQDMTKTHYYIDDFDATTNFTNHNNGTGGTATLVAGDGGIANVAVAATSGDWGQLQSKVGNMVIQAGYRAWCSIAFGFSAVGNNTKSVFGLGTATSTPFTAIADGFWFSTTNSGAVSINVGVNGTVTTAATGVTISAIGGTVPNVIASLYYDGALYGPTQGRIVWQLAAYNAANNGVSSAARGEVLGPTGFPFATNSVAPIVALQTNTTTAVNLYADWIFGCKDRQSIFATPTF